MKLGIVSPASPSTHTDVRKSQFEEGLKTIKSLGLEYEIAPHAANFLSYLSDTPEKRLADINQIYQDKSVEVIVAANGGWNSNQLLLKLGYEMIKRNPKPLFGFSDIAVLLNAIYAKTGVIQFHGPMVTWGFFENNEITNKSFLQAINRETQNYSTQEFGRFLKGDKLDGTLVGGNIITICTLLGTPYEPNWDKKVLFWEETEDTIYRVDRALTHFKNAGVWNKISGMVIGHLDQINEVFAGKRTDTIEMIKKHLDEYDFPILKTDLFGHNVPTNISIPIGGEIIADSREVSFKI